MIQIIDVEGYPPLELRLDFEAETSATLLGFHKERNILGEPLNKVSAVLRDHFVVRAKGRIRLKAWNLDVVSGKIRNGHSGSPVINSDNKALGVAYVAEGSEKAWIYSFEALSIMFDLYLASGLRKLKYKREDLQECKNKQNILRAKIAELADNIEGELNELTGNVRKQMAKLERRLQEHQTRWASEIAKYNEEMGRKHKTRASTLPSSTEYIILTDEIRLLDERVADLSTMENNIRDSILAKREEEGSIFAHLIQKRSKRRRKLPQI